MMSLSCRVIIRALAGLLPAVLCVIAVAGDQFVSVTPCRVVDTRNANGTFGGPAISGGTSRAFPISQGSCNIPSTATAFALNVTVVPQGPLGFLTVWPSGQTQPQVSTLNSYQGLTKANAAIVVAGALGSVSIYASDTTNVVLDISGYFVSDTSALDFYVLPECRVLDTRGATGALGGPSLVSGQARTFPLLMSSCNIPATAQAYSLNVTAVPQGSLGFLSVWPDGLGFPGTSTLNAPSATSAVANAAVVAAGSDGGIQVLASNAADLIVDINGYFAPVGVGGLSLNATGPCRLLDTRTLGSGSFMGQLTFNVVSAPCGIPSTAQAYVLNATVLPASSLGYLTLWPDGGSQPPTSTLNSYDAAVTSNMAIVSTTNGVIDVFASDPTQLILDISSYFSP